MELSIKEILNLTKEAPPFHRKSIEDSFISRKVTWSLKFSSIYQIKDFSYKVSCTTNDETIAWVYFVIDINKYPEFKTLKKDSTIKVSGTILKVEYNDITLNNIIIDNDDKIEKKISHAIEINNSQIHLGIGDNIKDVKYHTDNSKKWYEKPFGIIILMVLGGIILGGILYLLGWN